MPMQLYLNRFYIFIEDIARIWADFWIHLYGSRSLKISDSNGTWYLPFNGEKCENLHITASVLVGPSTVYGESQVISSLDGLLKQGIIMPEQYLKSMPKGVIPNVGELISGTMKNQTDEKRGDTE